MEIEGGLSAMGDAEGENAELKKIEENVVEAVSRQEEWTSMQHMKQLVSSPARAMGAGPRVELAA